MANTGLCPISQLPFLSKLLEWVVAGNVRLHLEDHALLDINQSAYHIAHSTETTLISVTDDVEEALDTRHYVVCVMLDLSAALDMVGYEMLMQRLEFTYGLSGTVLDWFHSYLTDRS